MTARHPGEREPRQERTNNATKTTGTQTLDNDNLDDHAREDDSGWYAMQWHVQDQWLQYDFGYVTPVGQLCLRWDDFKNITYGATSVRVDTSTDGTTWIDGKTYDEFNSGLMPGDMPNPYSTRRVASAYAIGQPLENVTLDDLCFNIEEEVTRYIRLFFANATDPEDLWLGVAEVGFKCGNAPTAAPTVVPTPAPSVSAAPTAVPTSGAICRPDILLPVRCGVRIPSFASMASGRRRRETIHHTGASRNDRSTAWGLRRRLGPLPRGPVHHEPRRRRARGCGRGLGLREHARARVHDFASRRADAVDAREPR